MKSKFVRSVLVLTAAAIWALGSWAGPPALAAGQSSDQTAGRADVVSVIPAPSSVIPAPAGIYSDLPKILDRSNYCSDLLALFAQAKDSIYVSQYLIVPTDRSGNDSAYRLMKGLVEAGKRGVEVYVAMEGSGSRLTQNKPALDFLQKNGVDAYFDSPDITNHEKTVIIDSRFVAVGSSNWTRPALDLNNEKNVLLDSPRLAGELIEKFPRKYQPGVKLPISLLSDKNFQRLFQDHAERQFDLYLLLVGEAQEKGDGTGTVKIDYKDLARRMGYREPAEPGQAETLTDKDLWRFLTSLEKDHGLIKTDRPSQAITINGYPKSWQAECLEIPFAYWQFGYDRALSFRAKYFYLIALAETKQSAVYPWWWRSLEDLSQKYGINIVSLDQGAGELENKNILEVYREVYLGGRQKANEYCLNPLLGAKERQAAWDTLTARFGAEKVAQARRQAEIMNDPNDPTLARRLIFLAEEYGPEKMASALAKLETYSLGSGRRQIRYLIGILRSPDQPGN